MTGVEAGALVWAVVVFVGSVVETIRRFRYVGRFYAAPGEVPHPHPLPPSRFPA